MSFDAKTEIKDFILKKSKSLSPSEYEDLLRDLQKYLYDLQVKENMKKLSQNK